MGDYLLILGLRRGGTSARRNRLADAHALLSHEHFTVDGTLLEAWASQKSFQPKTPEDPRPPSDGDPGNASTS